MPDSLQKLEKNLGRKIERQMGRTIPGTLPVAGQETVYFLDDGAESARATFQKLAKRVEPPVPQGGGASESGCTLHLPDGGLFHALSYHGDLRGWRQQITEGARQLCILTGTVAGNKFVISDGRMFDLADCRPEFY